MSLKMAVFDMDGVLVDIDSSWQLIHRAFGTDNEENFQRHLRGEIDFKEFMRSDIRLWGRVKIEEIKSILDQAPIMPSVPNTMDELEKAGYKTGIISSGISLLADRVKKTFNLDYSYANRLLTDENGWLTGEGEEVVGLLNKDLVLRKLAEEAGISTKQCAVIGDSHFDISLFREAGLSIAFNAKDEAIEKAADLVIEGKDLCKALLWLKSKNLMKAEASLKYGSAREAMAVANSVSPDNSGTPSGLQVRTWCEGKTVNVKIVCAKSVETMLATLDDVLACMQAADRGIKAVKPV